MDPAITSILIFFIDGRDGMIGLEATDGNVQQNPLRSKGSIRQ